MQTRREEYASRFTRVGEPNRVNLKLLPEGKERSYVSTPAKLSFVQAYKKQKLVPETVVNECRIKAMSDLNLQG